MKLDTKSSPQNNDTVQFKDPPPFISTRRSRIFVTKLRELSKAHVDESSSLPRATSLQQQQQQWWQQQQQNKKQHKTPRPPPETAPKPSPRVFQPIRTILDWSPCGGQCKYVVSFDKNKNNSNNNKQPSQSKEESAPKANSILRTQGHRHQPSSSNKHPHPLVQEKSHQENLHNFIFGATAGGGEHRGVVHRRSVLDKNSDGQWTTDDEEEEEEDDNTYDDTYYTSTPHGASTAASSLYTSEESSTYEESFDDTTTISTWNSQLRQDVPSGCGGTPTFSSQGFS